MAVTQSSSITVDGGAIPLTVCVPKGDGRLPALVVIPSIFGVHDDLVADMEQLADDGALVVALDPFWRVGAGAIPYADFARALERVGRYDRQRGESDLRQVIAWCREQARCSGRLAGLGICFGGPWCFVMAAEGELDAVACWHGSRLEKYVHLAPKMTCPADLHFGDRDPIAPPETVEAVRSAFAGREDVKVVVHAGATHGFSHEGDAYDAAAKAASMEGAAALLAGLRA